MLPPSPSNADLTIQTERLSLVPVESFHARNLWKIYNDEALHTYVPFEATAFEDHADRFARWATRISPSGDEIWLNWLVKGKESGIFVGHIQAGVKEDETAYIGYVISKSQQRQGFATEALRAAIEFMKSRLNVREIKAFVDTRNQASIRLVANLGMKKIALMKNADFFKGSASDEFVFSIVFRERTSTAP